MAASHTAAPDPRFPVGTVLSIYTGEHRRMAPGPAAVTTATVAADRTWTVTGLDYDTRYTAAAELDGRWLTTLFTTPADPATMISGPVTFQGEHNSVFITSGGYVDPTEDFTEVAPLVAPLNSGGVYDLDAPGNIFQASFGIYNTGSRAAVALYAHAEGAHGYGANISYLATDPGDEGTGMELDFGLRGSTGGVGEATGLNIHAQGAAGNLGGYLYMLANAEFAAPRVGWQIATENPNGWQPLTSDGTIMETSGAVQTQYGMNWLSAKFSGAGLLVPLNRGSAGSSIGIQVQAKGGLANTGSMIELTAADASSTAAFGIRFSSSPSKPVANSGTLIYVDGGTFGKAIDLSAATFAASGAVAMGDNNISFGTTTGGKIGTAANQKIGFFNAAPIVQPTGVAVSAAGIHAALVSLGLITA